MKRATGGGGRETFCGLLGGRVPIWAAVASLLAVSAAAGQVRVLKYDYAESLAGNDPLLINRNSQALSTYQSNSIAHFLVTGANTPETDTTLPAGMRIFGSKSFTNWGFAAIADHNGHTPMELYVAPIGQQAQWVATAPGSGSLSQAGLNDSGIVMWHSRDTVNHGLDTTWLRAPEGTIQQLRAAPDIQNYSGSALPIVDNTGRLTAGYIASVSPTMRMAEWTSGNGWTSSAVTDPVYGVPVTPYDLGSRTDAGQMAFLGRYYPPGSVQGVYYIYYYDGATVTRLMDATKPGTPTSARQMFTTLADDGTLLVRMGPAIGSNLLDDWTIWLRRPDGTALDLQSMLPAGKVEPPGALAAMNYRGDVLLEGKDAITGTYSYYLYDGTTVRPVIEDLAARAVKPQLANDGTMYFYVQEPSGRYSLDYVVPVPEPSAPWCVLAGATALLRRRRR